MRVERTTDTALIWNFMTRPDMWATVAEDGQSHGDFKPYVEGECWLSMTVDGTVIALFDAHACNGSTVEIHAQVLPEFRKEYSRACGQAALHWIMDNEPECQKIIAWVPTIYPNVRDFALSFGFRIEGRNRASVLKNGTLCDQWLLGVTRDEINENC